MSRALFLVYLSPALLAVLGLGVFSWARDRRAPSSEAHDLGKDSFQEALELIESEYVEPIDREELIAAAVKGMTDALDRHSRGYDAEELEAFRTRNRGDEAGIGIHFGRVGEGWWIFRVVARGPAERAGLRAGDRILAMDGVVVREDEEIDDMRERMRGTSGSTLRFRVQRWRSEDVAEIDVRRGFYRNEKVFARLTDDRLAYLRLSGFDESSALRVRREFDRLRDEGAEGYVLDLRGNLGGSVQAAVDIVGLFVSSNVVMTSVTRRDREIYGTDGSPRFPTRPLVVLTDADSASASEIVAGALQDLERAVVVGERSYGKGLVQNVFELRSRPYGLKFTVARWYTPAGRLIQRRRGDVPSRGGVVPDYPVTVTRAQRREIAREWGRQRITPEILAFMAQDEGFVALPDDYRDPVLEAARDWFAGRTSALAIKDR